MPGALHYTLVWRLHGWSLSLKSTLFQGLNYRIHWRVMFIHLCPVFQLIVELQWSELLTKKFSTPYKVHIILELELLYPFVGGTE